MNSANLNHSSRLSIAAINYANAGHSVFPVILRDKKPATKNGFKDATTDIKTINTIWKENKLNIGFPTGETNKCFVIDIDNPKDWNNILQDNNWKIPSTPAVKTARGYHYYFAIPEGMTIGCRTNIAGCFDVRGDGGYVVVPPSIHATGFEYSFITAFDEVPLALPPSWLLNMINNKAANTPSQFLSKSQNRQSLNDECSMVATAAISERNNTLNKVAFNLGKQVKAGVFTEAEVRAALSVASSECGLPVDESRKTINSGLTAGMKKAKVQYLREFKGRTQPESNEFQVRDDGVYFIGSGAPLFICSKLNIVAITRNFKNTNYGRLLEWEDADKNKHRWAMPMDMIAGDGLELRKVLLNAGVIISSQTKSKQLLIEYISRSEVTTSVYCVDKIGWHNNVYVLPDSSYRQAEGEDFILQTPSSESPDFTARGTLHEWQADIAKYCIGNSRLIFSVSTAFAAPLLHLLNMDGGGFNLKGNSSEGKSTALKAAASVCGGPAFVQTWRATDNGLESIAVMHNDALLAIDEMGQVDAKKAGEIAYMLANGAGKQRAAKSGQAQPKQAWRTMLLSTGEISLADHLSTIGQKIKAGQEVRLADIPMHTGKHGGFEELHGFKDGAELSEHLTTSCRQVYGIPFRTFIQRLSESRGDLTQEARSIQKKFIQRVVPVDAAGQVKRVAARFGLVAAGGYLASKFEITGWSEEEALNSAEICFRSWLKNRGGHAPLEDQRSLEQVKKFFQNHGESRFSRWGANSNVITNQRAGYVRYDTGQVTYYVFPEAFADDVCRGFDPQQVAKLCKQKGWLQPDKNGRNSQTIRLPDTKANNRMYVFTGKVLGFADEEA